MVSCVATQSSSSIGESPVGCDILRSRSGTSSGASGVSKAGSASMSDSVACSTSVATRR